MLLVIEGCDGVGKTSLARDLCDRVNGEYRHLSAPQRHPLEETVLDLDDYCPTADEHVVYDRFHVGELIYGPKYRGLSLLGPVYGPGHRYVDLYLRSRGGLIVHVDADVETARRRVAQRGDAMVDPSEVGDLLKQYRAALKYGLAPIASVEVPGRSGDVERLVILAKALEAYAAPAFEVTDRFMGDPQPTVLYVGDETSPTHLQGRRPLYRAPFVPYKNTSGWYLLEALPRAALDGAAFVNAVEVDLKAVYDAFGWPRVVALGRVAALELKRTGVPFVETRHPQYVRRFHHSKLAAWGAHVAALAEGKEVAWQ